MVTRWGYTIGKRPTFVPYNGKIADISESDTSKHTLDLQTALSETRNIIAVIVTYQRVSGSGCIYFYPNEGTGLVPNAYQGASFLWNIIIKADTNRLQYAQSVANDDFDLNCYGYVVED